MCGDTIYSRTNHDFHWCYCQGVYVDGGPAFIDSDKDDHWRFGFTTKERVENVVVQLDLSQLDLKAAIHELYIDWSDKIDKYGVIRDDEYSDAVRYAAKAKMLLEGK